MSSDTPSIRLLIALGNGAADVAAFCIPSGWAVPILVCGARANQIEQLRARDVRAMRSTIGSVSAITEILLQRSPEGAIGIIATLGGRTGSAALPRVGRILRRTNRESFVAISKPFSFEGIRRVRQARQALAASAISNVNALPLDSLFQQQIGPFSEVFQAANRWLFEHGTVPNAPSALHEYVHL